MKKINWDFGDYNSAKYPLDLNSIPSYPATFPAPIPKYLIGLLSEPYDIVFDPFGGKGTTAIEALKQRRRFIYNDLNPHAVSIMYYLMDAINQKSKENLYIDEQINIAGFVSGGDHTSYPGKNKESIYSHLPNGFEDELSSRRINNDAIYWFHVDTLHELILLYDYINSHCDNDRGIRRLAFISILKEVNSQRRHFSYITDNCKPTQIKYYNAIESYINMFTRIQKACVDFSRQYEAINKIQDLHEISRSCLIHEGDSRNCSYIQNESVDLIITSPPYLCAQDYTLSMRLNDFFFPNNGFICMPLKEIGPRRLRTKSGIVEDYFSDMKLVLHEIYRVLKMNGFFCLVIGQGKGNVSKGINVIEKVKTLASESGFIEIFNTTRTISYRTNRIGGVDTEDVIVYQKRND